MTKSPQCQVELQDLYKNPRFVQNDHAIQKFLVPYISRTNFAERRRRSHRVPTCDQHTRPTGHALLRTSSTGRKPRRLQRISAIFARVETATSYGINRASNSGRECQGNNGIRQFVSGISKPEAISGDRSVLNKSVDGNLAKN
jgi:hypothetical protein